MSVYYISVQIMKRDYLFSTLLQTLQYFIMQIKGVFDMSVDIKAMIMKKQNDKLKSSKLVMKDINRELITALIA